MTTFHFLVRRRPFLSRVFGGISHAARSIWRVGKRVAPTVGKVTHILKPFTSQIASVSPKAAAALMAVNAFVGHTGHKIVHGEEDRVSHNFDALRGAIKGAASTASHHFEQFRNHPITQGFMATQTGKTAIHRIKNQAVDMATRMGISPQQQRKAVDHARSFTAGIHKAANPPNRSRQYRTGAIGADRRTWSPSAVRNSMSQNIGLYGPSYFPHFFLL